MSKFKFNIEPRDVPNISSINRSIRTKIPVPESLALLKKIKKFESSNAVEQLPVIWDHAKNHQIFDEWGNSWIDFTSTIFVANSGHANDLVIKKLQECIDKPLLSSYYYPTRIRVDFLEKLIESTPSYLEKAILLSAGTEASERAIKVSRIHGESIKKGKNVIIGGDGNYHGKTLGAQMVGGQHADKDWIGFLDPNIAHMPFPFPWVIEEFKGSGEDLFLKHLEQLEINGLDLSRIAAFFVESFQGWAAVFYPNDYIQAMRKWSSSNNCLLVFDEIQAGFGRTGKFFAYEHYGVEPDLVICGKGISGSMPLSAILGSSQLIEMDAGYTSTHGGNPLSCAAGLGNLEAFESMRLVQEAERKGLIMLDYIQQWKIKYPERIGRILGKGMIFGVFITKKDSDELDIELTNYICERAMEKGVFSICTGRGTLKLGPPLTIPDDALVEGLKVYEECFDELFN
ncbi:aspartate aminotransferase family protein [Candidatus Thioglobus sp.]|nr:aspartate aminotransferase family protein [Candidatus Thioglobus sp.]